MKSLLVPSVAKYAFNKLLKGLKNFGYDANFASELELFSSAEDAVSYVQSIKIDGFDTTYGKIFKIKDDAPFLEVRIMAYQNPSIFVGTQYNLWAHIYGTDVYDWEGEDANLMQIVDSFLDDADSDIANAYTNHDYLDMSEENEIVNRLNEGLIQKINLDELSKQVSESTDSISLEELNTKVDTILDALGLVNEDKKDDKDDKDNNNLENMNVQHIEPLENNSDETEDIIIEKSVEESPTE